MLFLQNGHQHWVTGWFRDRELLVDPLVQGSTYQRLVSFVEYGNTAMYKDDVVLIQIKQAALYLQFNRAKGYNADADMGDTVTVTEGHVDDQFSYRRAALRKGETFILRPGDNNSTIGPYPLVITVCTMTTEAPGIVDFAGVSMHWDDGVQHSSCETAAPSATPSARPSPLRSASPSALPSNSPQPTISPAPSVLMTPRKETTVFGNLIIGIKQWPHDRVTSIMSVILLLLLCIFFLSVVLLWCGIGCTLMATVHDVRKKTADEIAANNRQRELDGRRDYDAETSSTFTTIPID
jgi:hypothetical protein